METIIHNFRFDNIPFNPELVVQLMGYKEDEVPPEITDTIRGETLNLTCTEDLKGGYVILPCKHRKTDTPALIVGEQIFEVGEQVAHLIENSEMVALFICTAGGGISRRSGELMAKGDILEGYVVDVIGSVLVEKVMDAMHKSIKEKLEKDGYKTTNRYSPGYCDWNVAEQRKLFSFFPQGFCGVTLTESALMQPIKSVSGIIGIGKDVNYKKYTCDICTQNKCLYRNLNTSRPDFGR